MKRHGFEPFALVAGVFFVCFAGLYLGDAAGAWHIPTLAALIVIGVGLAATGVTAAVTESVRSSRRRTLGE